ncbi:SdpA family antimicrobial peptide system protein [Streptomyces alkaliterrae]|uniref:SdpA family antimicrobial peptide system protein n=1 Tax=Streptomyces alkaliterrae TaxID=2213162 RepID=UPI002B213BB7|nr:SdpA family antimicrobial peptide system protein [Streptomyces alkaliterrae]
MRNETIAERTPLRAQAGPQAALSRRWLAVTGVLWAVAALYVAQANLPKNVIELPGQDKAATAVGPVAPQGWAFFTKSPRDVELVPYVYRDGEWRSALRAPHARPSNAFGLDRASRSQGIEMALLLERAGELTDWADCAGALTAVDCLDTAAASDRVRNPSPEPSLCGTAAIVQMRPVPWAWRDLLPGTHTPEKAATWKVSC